MKSSSSDSLWDYFQIQYYSCNLGGPLSFLKFLFEKRKNEQRTQTSVDRKPTCTVQYLYFLYNYPQKNYKRTLASSRKVLKSTCGYLQKIFKELGSIQNMRTRQPQIIPYLRIVMMNHVGIQRSVSSSTVQK